MDVAFLMLRGRLPLETILHNKKKSNENMQEKFTTFDLYDRNGKTKQHYNMSPGIRRRTAFKDSSTYVLVCFNFSKRRFMR